MLWNDSTNSLAARLDVTTDFAGNLDFQFDEAAREGDDHSVYLFVDCNSNSVCEPSPTDRAWQAFLGLAVGDSNHRVDHTTNYVDACPFLTE